MTLHNLKQRMRNIVHMILQLLRAFRGCQGLLFSLVLAAVLSVLFAESFGPGKVHFSNDGPLGAQNADYLDLPSGMAGAWNDLNSLGFSGGAWPVDITAVVRWVFGPLYFSKFWAAIALFILGCGAWFCFRQLGFNAVACALAGIATPLSSAFFSTACWGVASQQVAIGMNFVAVGLISSLERISGRFQRIARLALAGAFVGVGIMEGFDNGAIFSLFVGSYAVYNSISSGGGGMGKRLVTGIGHTAVIAICAALVSAQVLFSLITTQIQGVAGTAQDSQTKEQKWDWATQWSLPKKEVLAWVVPGLFGYRMDTPDGGKYWGAIGRDPAWDRYFASGGQGARPQGFMRFSGGGLYLGIPVALIAVWAVWQALRRKSQAFADDQKKIMLFWLAASVIALLLAFGRFAPFYKLLYALPYFSTIRNPIKFAAVFNFAVLILFAFGIDGLWRLYVRPTTPGGVPVKSPGDKRWILGSFVAVGVAIVGWIAYGASQGSMVAYLQTVQFDEGLARAIAKFSVKQVGWFVVLLIVSVVLLTMIIKGKFAGAKAKFAVIALGLLIVVDLGIANLPWTIFVDYKQKYESNPIVDMLREKPYEQRVAILPFRVPEQFELFSGQGGLYRIEWAQHHFPYYNIQSLDIVQMPRVPADLQAFETALHFNGSPESVYLIGRRWALTNTRYLLGPTGFLDVLNRDIAPEKTRFRVVQTFHLAPKAGIANPRKLEELTAVLAGTNGPYALFEFTGALPRAALFSRWEVPVRSTNNPAQPVFSPEQANELKGLGTNDFLTLQRLASPDFDPRSVVLLADNVAVPPPAGASNQPAGKVEYTSYSPKHIRLKTESAAASVLLLNDKYDANWKVTVDGKPAELLRCNFIMRGVYVPAGTHAVEFSYSTDPRPLYVTLASMVVCVLLAGYVAVSGRRAAREEKPSAP